MYLNYLVITPLIIRDSLILQANCATTALFFGLANLP